MTLTTGILTLKLLGSSLLIQHLLFLQLQEGASINENIEAASHFSGYAIQQ